MKRTRENVEKLARMMDKVMMRSDVLRLSAQSYSDLEQVQMGLRLMAEEVQLGPELKAGQVIEVGSYRLSRGVEMVHIRDEAGKLVAQRETVDDAIIWVNNKSQEKGGTVG